MNKTPRAGVRGHRRAATGPQRDVVGVANWANSGLTVTIWHPYTYSPLISLTLYVYGRCARDVTPRVWGWLTVTRAARPVSGAVGPGVGLSRIGFDRLEELFSRAHGHGRAGARLLESVVPE